MVVGFAPYSFAMTAFVRGIVVGAIVVGAAFTGVIMYSAKVLPTILRGSKSTVEQFFVASQHHQPEVARALFSSELRASMDTAQLQAFWRDFERQNGSIQNWMPADPTVRGGGHVCLWPRYVDYIYRVQGTKGDSRVFYAHVVPVGAEWRIERLNIMR